MRDGEAGKGMSEDTVYPAWEVDQHRLAHGELAAAARDGRLGEPQLRLAIQTDRGDTITVRVVQGVAPSRSGSVLYVAGRGVFRLVRRVRSPGARAASAPGAAGAVRQLIIHLASSSSRSQRGLGGGRGPRGRPPS